MNKVTIKTLEKVINRDLNTFDEVFLTPVINDSPLSISTPYVFLNNNDGTWNQLTKPFTYILLKNKNIINQRIKYLEKIGWKFHKILIDSGATIEIIFKKNKEAIK